MDDLDQITSTFGLGRTTGRVRELKGADVVTVDTESGTWVIKTVRPHSEWQLRSMRRTGELERAAVASGIELAQPVEPPAGHETIGYWARLGDRWVRVHEHLAGEHPGRPFALDAATWLGGVVARLAALDLPADVRADDSRPLYPAAEWAPWLADADRAGLTSARTMRAAMPVVTSATALVEDALATGVVSRLMHRDLADRNVLRTPAGHRLVDWDHAGPEVPWWEAVAVAMHAAQADDLAEPDPATFRAVIDGYADRGGPIGPADHSAFAGLVWSQVAYTAYVLWVACGHRGGDAVRRAGADRDVIRMTRLLTHTVSGLDRWVSVLA